MEPRIRTLPFLGSAGPCDGGSVSSSPPAAVAAPPPVRSPKTLRYVRFRNHFPWSPLCSHFLLSVSPQKNSIRILFPLSMQIYYIKTKQLLLLKKITHRDYRWKDVERVDIWHEIKVGVLERRRVDGTVWSNFVPSHGGQHLTISKHGFKIY